MDAINVGSWKQLFIDDYLIDYSKNVSIKINPPVKAGPVLRADKPWESFRVGAYGTVLEVDGEYRMYYDAIDDDDKVWHCLAISKDGIHWEKPNLSLVEYKGSKDNNILPLAPCGTVFIDPHDVPGRRFKYVTYGHRIYGGYVQDYGVRVWWSEDGIRWTRNEKIALPLNPDTQNQVFWDDRIGKYVAYLRAWDPLRCIARVEIEDISKPWPFKPREDVSYDLNDPKKWVHPTTELPVVFKYDGYDPEDSDHYNPCVIKYPYAKDVYFMFPSAYLHFPDPPVGKYRNDGLLDIQIATSRDGIHWNRLTRETYVRLGKEGELDSKQMYMLVGMIRRDDEIWMYYSGYSHTHGEADHWKELGLKYEGAIFRLIQRLDGFTSLDAGYRKGEIITKSLKFKGKKLVLNVDTSATGELKIEILNEERTPFSKYKLENFDTLHINSCHVTATWNGSPDLTPLQDKIIRLRFVMRNTKLYSFQFV